MSAALVLAFGAAVELHLPVASAAESSSVSVLARSAPADARLFLEIHGFESFANAPIGYVVSRMVGGLVTTSRPASTQPAGSQPTSAPTGLKGWFAEAVGLDKPKVVDLLFSGPIAFAAGGWSGLGDAVLLAEPRDAASIETSLASCRVEATQGAKVRRYRLAHEHELACDGRAVVVGRSTSGTGLFARTVAVWASEGGASLWDIGEFRERIAGLRPGVQMIFYAGTSSRDPDARLLLGPWWPADWPQLRSLAVGVGISPGGIVVDADGRVEVKPGAASPPPVSVESLVFLPASTVLAWTQPFDFGEAFRRLAAEDAEGVLPMLLADLPPRAIEWQLFGHFVGNAIFVVAKGPGRQTATAPASAPASAPAVTKPATSPAATPLVRTQPTVSLPVVTQTAPATKPTSSPAAEPRPAAAVTAPATTSAPGPAIPPVSATRPSTRIAATQTSRAGATRSVVKAAMQPLENVMAMPVLAMLVETDDPHAVESILERLTLNLQRLVAGVSPGGAAERVRRVNEAGGGQIISLSLARLFAPRSDCPFLRTLEISWSISDRWLIIGTNEEIVRQLVAARRLEGELWPTSIVPQAVLDAVKAGWPGQMLLLAQPRALSGMIDSWVMFIEARYPEMLQSEWWRRLERRQRSTRVQLGVVPANRAVPGAVEVGETMAGYPAAGRLYPGDCILGVNGQPLNAESPARSLREMLAVAGEAGKVTLQVLRKGKQEDIVIPMPQPVEAGHSVQPIQLLQQAGRFLKLFPSASYAVWRPKPGLLKAHLELRFSTATAPVP